MARLGALGLVFVSTLMASCGGSIREVDLPAATATPVSRFVSQPAGAARIAIASPAEGARLGPKSVKIVARVKGFSLVDATSGGAPRSRPGEGRIVYYMGESFVVPTVKNASAVSGGNGTYLAFESAETSYVWSNAALGTQTFAAQLVGSDGAPLDPPQVARVTVTIRAQGDER